MSISTDVVLLEELCNYYIAQKEMPPLAAKVYSLLLLDVAREGLTFDELVDFFQAGKSSISGALNFLLQSKQVEAITRLEERKRYFRIDGKYLLIRLNRQKDLFEKELELTERYLLFAKSNENANECVIQRLQVKINAIKNRIVNLNQTFTELLAIKDI